MGCFASYLGITSSFQAEFCAAKQAIKVAIQRGWKNLWLECDSMLIVQASKSPNIVSWKLSNRWKNCIMLSLAMNFHVSHVFREGNHCADKLAAFGVSSRCFTWWDLIPQFSREDFFRDRFGLPNYRFK